MYGFEKPHFFAFFGIVLLAVVAGMAIPANCQSAENNDSSLFRRPQEPPPKSVRDMLAKQRLEKQKREHDELLKRGEEAALISQQLEITFAASNQLSESDLSKLESLEKLVSRIRKSLGGDDEEGESGASGTPLAARDPNSLKEAFSDLKEMTGKLVDELKKTSRYTVSVVAIQSTNSVLKLVRFLRLRR